MSLQEPVLIIGAGVVGLTLAHGLKKVSNAMRRTRRFDLTYTKQAGIPFQIFERDEDVMSRGQGWAITIHWALPYLRQLLSPETFSLLDDCQVDPEVGRNDTGNFLFINLETLEAKFKIPPNERRRVSREKMRNVLLDGVKEHVQWRKRLVDIQTSADGVTATFEDGTQASGSLVVGAEGSNSRVRKHLRPDAYRNTQLPVRFLGSAVDMTPSEVKPLRDLDPLLFQGCHPTTGTFLWVSMLETPLVNGTQGTEQERYKVQINLSWLVKGPEDELRPSDHERMAEMKRRAECFAPSLRKAVQTIPDDAPVLEIVLADWPCLEWESCSRVTLAGDAAHAMTMYRGEAANHGILDAYYLTKRLEGVYGGHESQDVAITKFEHEMRERTGPAVLLSRQACLDAHDWEGLNENSAVLKQGQIVVQ